MPNRWVKPAANGCAAVLSWEHSAPVLLAAYDRLWPADDGGRVIDSERPARHDAR
jgi:hypothetical protein